MDQARLGVELRLFDLVQKNAQTVIGYCGFHRWNQKHARAELGYELFEKFRGQGYMTEAMKALVAFGFQKMSLHRIEAQIDPHNQGSIRVVQKLGFEKEGILRGHHRDPEGQFHDTTVFALLKPDWELFLSTT